MEENHLWSGCVYALIHLEILFSYNLSAIKCVISFLLPFCDVVCVRVACAFMCVCMPRGQQTPWVLVLASLLLECLCCCGTRLAVTRSSGDSPFPAPISLKGHLDYTPALLFLALWASADLNSCLHTSVPSTVSTEPSLQAFTKHFEP